MITTIIGDVHGNIEKLKKIIEIINVPLDEICLVGDLIDRGDHSIEVLEFVRSNNIKCVLGNHEQMLIEALNGSKYWLDNWRKNGAKGDLDDYREYSDFLNSLPLTIHLENNIGKKFVISHSMICDVYTLKESNEKFRKQCLWARPQQALYLSDTSMPFVNIIGHTPVEDVIQIANTIFIDTGCAYGMKLSAYNINTKENYYV